MIGQVNLEIDQDKIDESVCWDGLKGYLTNTDLSADAVIENYSQLWHIEKAFRISKTDLRIRPMYHRRKKRIQAHILVAFIAYTIYKELERRLKEADIPISPKRAAELTQNMYEISFKLPTDPQLYQVLLKMNDEQRKLYNLLY
jgi:transposase